MDQLQPSTRSDKLSERSSASGQRGSLSHRNPIRAIIKISPGNCWPSYFHAIRLSLLRWILAIFGPSTKAYLRYDFRHFGVDQQYPPVIGAADHLYNNPIGQCTEI